MAAKVESPRDDLAGQSAFLGQLVRALARVPANCARLASLPLRRSSVSKVKARSEAVTPTPPASHGTHIVVVLADWASLLSLPFRLHSKLPLHITSGHCLLSITATAS